MAIAASGAAMVSLIEHAGDGRSPAASAYLLAASVAIMLLSLILVVRALADFSRLIRVYQPVQTAMAAGALVALAMGWLRPAPWIFVLLLALLQTVVWWFAVDRWLRYGDHTPVESG